MEKNLNFKRQYTAGKKTLDPTSQNLKALNSKSYKDLGSTIFTSYLTFPLLTILDFNISQ